MGPDPPPGEAAGGSEPSCSLPLAMVVSKSFASRRLRPDQPRVRSTTQRRGSTSKPLAWSDRLTISRVHCPSPASAVSSFSPGVSAVGKDVTQQPREEIADRRQNPRRPVAVLDVSGMHLGPVGLSPWRAGC
jgi:putative transposase